MLLFILLGSTPIYSQWQNCIEDGDNYDDYKIIPWDAPGNVSELISLGYLLDENLAMNTPQKLLIQRDISFNVQYNFAPGSKIIFISSNLGFDIIDPVKLTIDDTKINVCEDYPYWRGIVVNTGTQLYIYNSTLEGANAAIDVVGDGEIIVENNTFKNNYQSILIEANIPVAATIKNNTFDFGELNNSSDYYNIGIHIKDAQFFSLSESNKFNNFKNYEISPGFITKYEGAAIYSENVDGIRIENQEFNNCQTGIWVNNKNIINTDLIVNTCSFNYPNNFNTSFNDISTLNTKDIEIKYCNFNLGTSIKNCQNVTFEKNVSTKISVLDIFNCNHLYFKYNSSDYYNGSIIEQGINLEICNYLDVAHNVFTGNMTAIKEINTLSSSIKENEFNCSHGIAAYNSRWININNNDFNVRGTGVFLNGFVGTSGNINNNIFTFENGGTGVHTNNFNCLWEFAIFGNDFINNSTNEFIGAFIQNTRNLNFKENNISSQSLSGETNNGILISNWSEDNNFINNIIEGSGSTYDENGYLGGVTTELSPSNNYLCNDISNYNNSIRVVDFNDNTNLYRNEFSNYTGNAIRLKNTTFLFSPPLIGPQKHKFNKFNVNDNTIIDVFTPSSEIANLNQLTINTLDYPYWPDPVTNEIIRVYDPNYVENISNLCILSESPKDYTDLTDVMKDIIEDDSIPELGGPLPPGMYWNYNWTTYDVINENPNILQENQDANNYFFNISNQPLGQLWSIDNFIWNELPLIDDNREEAILEKLNLLSEINTNEIYELNMKQVLEIILKQLLYETNDLTQEQKDILLNIASQCHLYGGKAVDISRGMLGIEGINYGIEKCEEVEQRSEISDINLIETSIIYPNPNKGSFSVFINKEINHGILTISNGLGEIIYQQKIDKNSGNLNIDLENLKNGIYFCKIFSDKKLFSNSKFVIQK